MERPSLVVWFCLRLVCDDRVRSKDAHSNPWTQSTDFKILPSNPVIFCFLILESNRAKVSITASLLLVFRTCFVKMPQHEVLLGGTEWCTIKILFLADFQWLNSSPHCSDTDAHSGCVQYITYLSIYLSGSWINVHIHNLLPQPYNYMTSSSADSWFNTVWIIKNRCSLLSFTPCFSQAILASQNYLG